MPGVPTPLRTEDSFDFVVVRENTGDEYAGSGGWAHHALPMEIATQTSVATRAATSRIVEYAFDLAQRRRRRLTSITNSKRRSIRHRSMG
jgi:tartrate dehydrogenase/decarboxylase / D-malate dehydrogenase